MGKNRQSIALKGGDMKGIKFNLFILMCAILMVVSVSVLHWTTYQAGMREGEVAQKNPVDNLKISHHWKIPSPPTDEVLLLSYKKAIELKREFPIVSATFVFRNMMWPLSQSLAIDRFIDWLYENDYEIVKKEDK